MTQLLQVQGLNCMPSTIAVALAVARTFPAFGKLDVALPVDLLYRYKEDYAVLALDSQHRVYWLPDWLAAPPGKARQRSSSAIPQLWPFCCGALQLIRQLASRAATCGQSGQHNCRLCVQAFSCNVTQPSKPSTVVHLPTLSHCTTYPCQQHGVLLTSCYLFLYPTNCVNLLSACVYSSQHLGDCCSKRCLQQQRRGLPHRACRCARVPLAEPCSVGQQADDTRGARYSLPGEPTLEPV